MTVVTSWKDRFAYTVVDLSQLKDDPMPDSAKITIESIITDLEQHLVMPATGKNLAENVVMLATFIQSHLKGLTQLVSLLTGCVAVGEIVHVTDSIATIECDCGWVNLHTNGKCSHCMEPLVGELKEVPE